MVSPVAGFATAMLSRDVTNFPLRYNPRVSIPDPFPHIDNRYAKRGEDFPCHVSLIILQAAVSAMFDLTQVASMLLAAHFPNQAEAYESARIPSADGRRRVSGNVGRM